MYIHKHHAPNEPPAFPALPRQADGRQQRAAAPRAAAGALAPQLELWEIEAVLPQMEASAKVPGVPGGQLWFNGGLMGVNQQNGDFNGMYPLVN